MSGTQLLSFSEFVLYKSGEIYSVNSCETIEVFYNIRMDIDKLKAVANITKIINDVTTENQNNYRVLQLYLNTLYTMANTLKNIELILSIFKIRLLSIIGFRPTIDCCRTCGKNENIKFFSIRDNGFKCEKCAFADKGAIEMEETTRDAIKYIVLTDAKKIFSFDIPENSANELKLISQIYLNEKLEKEYKL